MVGRVGQGRRALLVATATFVSVGFALPPSISSSGETLDVADVTDDVTKASDASDVDGAKTLMLNGVTVAISGDPHEMEFESPAGGDVQVSSTFDIYGGTTLSIQSVPYGEIPHGYSQPAEPGKAPLRVDQLRTHREMRGASAGGAPTIEVFGETITGARSVLPANATVGGTPQAVAEWVADDGQNLWYIEFRSPPRTKVPDLTIEVASTSTSEPSPTQPHTESPTALSMAPESVDTMSAPSVPLPSWWEGICNAGEYSAFYQIREWNNLRACETRGSDDTIIEPYFPGVNQYQWQCAELSKRWVYLAWGYDGWSGNGDYTARNFMSAYPGQDVFRLVGNSHSNNGADMPVPGDVVSMIYGQWGHTAVVTDVNIDSGGDGTITTIEQNASASGIDTLYVDDYYISDPSRGTNIEWLHQLSADIPDSPGDSVTCDAAVRMFQLRPGSGGANELWYSSLSNADRDSGVQFYRWRKIYTFSTKPALAVAAHKQANGGVYLYVTDADGGLRGYKYDIASGDLVGAKWLHNPDASDSDVDPYAFSSLTSTGIHLYGVNGSGRLYLMTGLDLWEKPNARRVIKYVGWPAALWGDGEFSNSEVGYTGEGYLRYVDVRAEDAPTYTLRDGGWFRKSITSPGGGMLLYFRGDGMLWRHYIGDPKQGADTEITQHKTLAIGTGTPNYRITTTPNTCTA